MTCPHPVGRSYARRPHRAAISKAGAARSCDPSPPSSSGPLPPPSSTPALSQDAIESTTAERFRYLEFGSEAEAPSLTGIENSGCGDVVPSPWYLRTESWIIDYAIPDRFHESSLRLSSMKGFIQTVRDWLYQSPMNIIYVGGI